MVNSEFVHPLPFACWPSLFPHLMDAGKSSACGTNIVIPTLSTHGLAAHPRRSKSPVLSPPSRLAGGVQVSPHRAGFLPPCRDGNDRRRVIFERAERRGGISLWKAVLVPRGLIHLQVSPPPRQVLFFQLHSRFRRVTTFIFYNIPAFLPGVPEPSFVFSNIPASSLRLLKFLVSSLPLGGDILSRAVMPAKAPVHPATLKCSRRKAGVAQVPFGACPSAPGDLRHFKGSRQKVNSRCSSFSLPTPDSWFSS